MYSVLSVWHVVCLVCSCCWSGHGGEENIAPYFALHMIEQMNRRVWLLYPQEKSPLIHWLSRSHLLCASTWIEWDEWGMYRNQTLAIFEHPMSDIEIYTFSFSCVQLSLLLHWPKYVFMVWCLSNECILVKDNNNNYIFTVPYFLQSHIFLPSLCLSG